MSKSFKVAISLILIIAGCIFWAQGLGVVEGSPMTGSKFWAYTGPIIAGLGVALLVVTFQKRR